MAKIAVERLMCECEEFDGGEVVPCGAYATVTRWGSAMCHGHAMQDELANGRTQTERQMDALRNSLVRALDKRAAQR